MKYICLLALSFVTFQGLAQGSAQLTLVTDIKYYVGEGYDSLNHKFNMVIPNSIEEVPLLVWIGGGAWSKVDRHMEMDLAQKLAQQGIIVATLGHRLSAATWEDSTLVPTIKHPKHVTDVARAVKFLLDHASEYGFSPDKVFVGGFSSGAHLAALLAMDTTYLVQQGLSKTVIKGLLPVSGTFDIPHYHQILADGMGKDVANRHIESVFGLSKQEMISASPTNYLEGFDIPMLLISDRNMLRYHMYFEEKLRTSDIRRVEAIHLFNYGHTELWRHLSYDDSSKYRDAMISFIWRTLQLPASG